MTNHKRIIQYERLRPGQLIRERTRCPLIFVPVAPLEYHGPHLPVGMDPINATLCAYETCQLLGKGVVFPTVYCGTERERPAQVLENLGFQATAWVVGMDFPSALWKSDYSQEHLFGMVLANTLELLIAHAYKLIVIVNGHGAMNQKATLERVCRYYSHTTDTMVVWGLALPDDVISENHAGHADVYETSLMCYFQEYYGEEALVDLSTLPERSEPIRYPDFSIVDGPGFRANPDKDLIVKADPRDATPELGKAIFQKTVQKFVRIAEEGLKEL